MPFEEAGAVLLHGYESLVLITSRNCYAGKTPKISSRWKEKWKAATFFLTMHEYLMKEASALSTLVRHRICIFSWCWDSLYYSCCLWRNGSLWLMQPVHAATHTELRLNILIEHMSAHNKCPQWTRHVSDTSSRSGVCYCFYILGKSEGL